MTKAFVAVLLLMLRFCSSLSPLAFTKAPTGTVPKIEPHDVTASTSESNGIKAIPFVLELNEEDFKEMYSRETLRRRRGTRLRNLLYTSWLVIRDHVSSRFKKMTAEERNIVNIYKRTLPSVTELTVYTRVTDDDDGGGGVSNRTILDLGWIAKEGNIIACSVSSGSGVLWDDQGHIVTNHHVLYSAGPLYKVKVRFPGMVDFLDVEVVGSTQKFDLAVLKVSPTQYNPAMANPLKLLPKPIRKASSKVLRVGQTCLLIGSPNGLFSTALTTGIVSDLGITAVVEYGEVRGSIKTSAVLGRGSSGGPLLDSQGQLIGINFAGTDDQKGKQQGFAIPVDIVKRNVNQIIRNGYAQSSTIGVSFASSSLQEELDLQKGSFMGGAMISHVFRNSPGDNAGLQECVVSKHKDGGGFVEPRDIVIAADGKRVRNSDELFAIFDTKMPGNTVLLTVSRAARIGDIDRWTEVIPIKLITFDQLSEVSDEFKEEYG